MNKRKFPRQPVSIDAVFGLSDTENLLCTIKDFSQDGMFIAIQDPKSIRLARERLPQVSNRATVTLRADGRYQTVMIDVMHLTDVGAGVRFSLLNTQFIEVLQQAAGEFEQAAKATVSASVRDAGGDQRAQLSPRDKSQLVTALSSNFSAEFNPLLAPFIETLQETLLQDSERQASNTAQTPYFDAMAALTKHGRRLTKQLSSTIESDALDLAGSNRQAKSAGMPESEVNQELSLIEKDEFEDWLVVRVTTTRMEMHFQAVLNEIQIRLDAAFGSESDSGVVNPFSPASLCQALGKLTRSHNFSNKVERRVFEIFEKRVLKQLGTAYQYLNDAMIRAGVLPGLDITRTRAPQRAAGTSSARSAGTIPSPAPVSSPLSTMEAGSDGAPEPQSSVPVSAITDVERAAIAQALEAARTGGRSAPPAVTDNLSIEQMAALNTGSLQVQPNVARQQQRAYSAASTFLRVSQAAVSNPERLRSDQLNDGPSADEHDKLAQFMSTVRQQVLDDSLYFEPPDTLYEFLATRVEVAPETLEPVHLVEALVADIVDNDKVDVGLKKNIRTLALPLLENLLHDPSLFEKPDHPLRIAINQIATLSDRQSPSLNRNREFIVDSIQRLVTAGANNGRELQTVSGLLQERVQREQALIQRNLSRVIELSEGQVRIHEASKRVDVEIGQRLGGHSIPMALYELIDQHWRELMRLSLLREGDDSRSWKVALTVIEQLVIRIVPEAWNEAELKLSAEDLLKLIQKGLSKFSLAGAKVQALLGELQRYLLDRDFDGIEWKLFENTVAVDASAQPGARSGIQERWCKRARKLKIGQYVEFTSQTGVKQTNQLAWCGENHEQMVFVNNQGVKARELSLDALAELLRKRQAVILNESNLTAIERGLDSLVQKLYQQVAEPAFNDSLTGLPGRREFERNLAEAVGQAKAEEREFALAVLSVRQFELINSTHGRDNGDALLGELGKFLDASRPDGAVISCLGGSHFALLLPDHSEQKAYLFADGLKTELEKHRFLSIEGGLPQGIVMALTHFDAENERVLELLQAVEFALGKANRQGVHEIQLIRPGDERSGERKQALEWIARINRALDRGLIAFRCQRIEGVGEAQGKTPLYEILLAVTDQDGTELSPKEFIAAAEVHNMIGAVDRWVIENLVAWMRDNEQGLDKVGGFMLNLSGQSINDETLLDFLFETFVKYRIPLNKLTFEITETTAIASIEDAADLINELRQIGCRFSLDDFGSGQSSYNYLKKLPVDFIKIDGSYIKDIRKNDVDYALVKSITEMGHFMDKGVIAKSVESADALEEVTKIGVDYVQGFQVQAPVAITELLKKASKKRSRAS